MSVGQNKDLAVRFFSEIINDQHVDKIDEFADPDYVLYFPGQPPLKRDQMHAVLAELHTGFPDFSVDIEEIIAEEDAVAALVRMTGTHQGMFQGIPPTGKCMEMHGQVFLRLRDGKIVEDRPVYDRLSLLEQLGIWKQPAAQPTTADSQATR